MRQGNILIAAGAFMLFFALVYPLVTLVVDTSKAEIGFTYTVPQHGGVYYEITVLTVQCRDMESGIKSVTVTITSGDQQYQYNLEYSGNVSLSDGVWEIWEYQYPDSAINTPGNHNFSIIVLNNAGYTTYHGGYYTIYVDLAGEWYINDQLITDSSQTVYSGSSDVTFKFVKTAGLDDSEITCWIEENGATLLTLTNTGSGVWTGTYTFSPGTHSITLKADDGISSISFSIIELTIPGAEQPTVPQPQQPSPRRGMQQLLFIGGVGLIALGLYSSKRRERR